MTTTITAPPHHLLSLSDRLFFSVREAWASALRSTSDVKELIPQVGIAPTSHDAVHELYSPRLTSTHA